MSVDTNINSQEYFDDKLHIFSVAKILFFTAEKIFFSSIFTCLYAEAWKIISTLFDLIISSKINLSQTSINLKSIKRSLNVLRKFPTIKIINKFEKKVLCIYGGISEYVKETHFKIF